MGYGESSTLSAKDRIAKHKLGGYVVERGERLGVMEKTERVILPPGETSAVLGGSVVRGERDAYLLGAQAGQQMSTHISSLEDNVVFTIYEPSGEQALPGAGERDGATEWSGELPTSGDYTIVVGGTRGNATYSLEVNFA